MPAALAKKCLSQSVSPNWLLGQWEFGFSSGAFLSVYQARRCGLRAHCRGTFCSRLAVFASLFMRGEGIEREGDFFYLAHAPLFTKGLLRMRDAEAPSAADLSFRSPQCGPAPYACGARDLKSLTACS